MSVGMTLIFSKYEECLELRRVDFEFERLSAFVTGDKVLTPYYGNASQQDRIDFWSNTIRAACKHVPDTTPVNYIPEATLMYTPCHPFVPGGDSVLNYRTHIPGRQIETDYRFLNIVLPEDSTFMLSPIFTACYQLENCSCINPDWYDDTEPNFVINCGARPIYLSIETNSVYKTPKTIKPLPQFLKDTGFPSVKEIVTLSNNDN